MEFCACEGVDVTGSQLASLLGFSALLSGGQVLFKVSALALQTRGQSAGNLLALGRLPSFWLALALYGCGTLLWIWILQSVPLSRAYPFAALGFVAVPVIAAVFFAERLSPAYGVGALLIVAGVIVTSRA